MPRQHNIQHDAMNEPLNTDSAVGATRSSRATTCLREALAIFVGGVGLLTDSYDFAIINLVRADLAKLYPVDDFENSWQRSMITASSIFGAMGGQLRRWDAPPGGPLYHPGLHPMALQNPMPDYYHLPLPCDLVL